MTDAAAAVIRDPTPADADRIARVHVDAWRETYSGLVPERYFGERAFLARRDWWSALLSAETRLGRIAVAEVAGEIVGFASSGPSVGPDAERGHASVRPLQLYTIYVLAARHGSGAGQGLIDAVLGVAPAQLWVARDNPRARRFYARNGFVPDGVQIEDPDISGLVEVRLIR